MKIFLIAGEASGDFIGAKLIQALRLESDEPLEIMGIGGPLMIAEGLKCLLPMDRLSLMGIFEIIPKLPELYKIYNATVQEIEKTNPDILITIDAPDFNFRVAKAIKSRKKYKGKIVHYVAPTVWAWRAGRAQKIARFLDGLICLYPFEVKYFTKHKLKTISAGHPMIETPVCKDGMAFREELDIPPEAKTIGVFFGSREGELNRMSHVLQEALVYLAQEHSNLYLIVPTLPKLEYRVRNLIQELNIPAQIIVGQDQKAEGIAVCNLAIAVSGTAGLELAYAGIPHIIGYKMSLLSWVLVKVLVKTKYAHLANVILEKSVVPEFLQRKFSAENILNSLDGLITDSNIGNAQKKEFDDLRDLMVGGQGDASPSVKASKFILKIAKS